MKLYILKEDAEEQISAFLGRKALPPCGLNDLFSLGFFFQRKSVEGWRGVSGNTDPINLSQWAQCLLTSSSPVSLLPHPPSLFIWNQLSVTAQRAYMIPICPAAEEAALVHSTWTVTSTSITSSFLQNKRSAYFLFFWPILFSIRALCDLRRLDKQAGKLKYELMEVVEKWTVPYLHLWR